MASVAVCNMPTHRRKNAFAKTLQSTSKQLIWLFSINGYSVDLVFVCACIYGQNADC